MIIVHVGNGEFANRDDGQDGSLHDFVIEFDMFHMRVLWVMVEHSTQAWQYITYN